MNRRRRGADHPELTTIYWRDIPAQVTATSGTTREKALLSPRFQNAIDRSAGVAGLTAADDYVTGWRRSTRAIQGDLLSAATAEAERLETEYPRLRLEELVRQGGTDSKDGEPTSAGNEQQDPK